MATTYTWGTGGTYASVQAILSSLGSLSEDIECRLAGDSTFADRNDFEITTDTYNLNGYTLEITNPNGYTCYVGTTSGSGDQLYNLLSRNGTGGNVIVDGQKWELYAYSSTGTNAKLFIIGNENNVTIRNCRIRLAEAMVQPLDYLFTRYSEHSGTLYVYNTLLQCWAAQTTKIFTPSGTGQATFEDCTFINCYSLSGIDIDQPYHDFINTYIDILSDEHIPTTNYNDTLASNLDSTKINSNLRNLALADNFIKYNDSEWNDSGYMMPLSDSNLITYASYPPTIPGHATHFDGTTITSDNASVGYGYYESSVSGGTNIGTRLSTKLLGGLYVGKRI